MAFTEYTGDTTIIGALGTNPAERGLTTQEFKDKFDQFADEFVAWFNETHLPEVAEKAVVDEHKAETTPHGADATAVPNKIALRDNKGQVVGFTPSVRVYKSVAQSIANDVFNDITFDTVVIDNDEMYNASNPTKLTCKTPGYYLIIADINFNMSPTGNKIVAINKNGSLDVDNATYVCVEAVSEANFGNVVHFSTIYYLKENDYVICSVKQTSGNALNVRGNFMMIKVGD